MANELTTRFSLAYAKGGDAVSIPSLSQVLDITGVPRIDKIVEIGTTEEALDFDDVAAAGGVFFAQNLDDTNYIDIGLTGSYPFRLAPSSWCKIEVTSLSLYAKADTAACDFRYMLFSV